ncbi:MAG: hypothetical protein HGA65_08385 [Oscillochloris sp.]|nr:hypothetical protein [Oscillochloris sp.]
MSASLSPHPAELRRAVGDQLARYRTDRRSLATLQRRQLAAQSAQIHNHVIETLADFAADQVGAASFQRAQLRVAVSAIREEVADLLQSVAADRRDQAAAAQQRRAQDLDDLRRQVAAYMHDLRAQRTARAAEQWARLRHPRAAAAPPAAPDGVAQRIGQAGMVAYVQMARVAILRALEHASPGEAQERQVGPQIEGLIGSLKTFLAESALSRDQLSPAERSQLGEVLAGVQRNLVALILELETTPWPTATAQRQTFLRLVEDLRRRLSPLREELDVALLDFQDDPRPAAGRARRSSPSVEPPTSYRDNLTAIHGVGPALQQRLNRAGICTYIQLALSSPEELRRALGDAGRLANIEDWIVQARSLAGMPA